MDELKKVATITYHRSDNFGSVLQAYALGEKLRQLGYEQFVVDYRKPEVAQAYKILQPMNSKYNVVTNFYHLLHYSALKRRKHRYEDFRSKWLRLSQVYTEKQALMAAPPEADAYITGSDQVWSPAILDFDESYLLDFVKKGKKISYAASGIKSNTDEKDLQLLRKHIADFDAVSVREQVAKTRLGGEVPPQICIDPVLLLEKQDWVKLCSPQKRKKPYMLCYFAGMATQAFEDFTCSKAKELGLERVILMPQWRNLYRTGANCYDAGPEEFVSLIQQAEIVCTNSFHGTAFSLLMNRPFIVGQAKPFEDDRIATLLGAMGLNEREIDPATDVYPEKLLELDFDKVNKVLEQLRCRDIQWLCEQIEGE